jgi:hypothetical protein
VKNTSFFLRNLIGPQVLGVLWISEAPLEKFPKAFLEMDYFLDGLLTHHLQKLSAANHHPADHEKNYFLSTSFGTPFFVAHLHHTKIVLGDVKELIQMALPLAAEYREKNTIILLADRPLALADKLAPTFENLRFKDVSLTEIESEASAPTTPSANN